MDVGDHIDEILRAGDGELPSAEDMNNPVFWMKCLRSAYGRGYLDGQRLDAITVAEAERFEREQWARLPIP